MLKDRTLLCISCGICPTIYVNKHLSRLTYGRARAKGSNPVVTRTDVLEICTFKLKGTKYRNVICCKILLQVVYTQNCNAPLADINLDYCKKVL